MKVLFIHPPPLGKNTYLGDIVYPPLGIAYLASVVRKDHEVKLLDANALRIGLKEIRKIIDDFSPDIVGITSTTANIFNAFEIADICKEINKDPVVILGGIHATASTEHALSNKNIDFTIRGEGEITFPELLEAIENKKDFSKIKGIAYRKEGKVSITEPRPLIQDLDSIPMPAYDLLPMNKYNSVQASSGKIMTIISSRGCPYQCIFCDVQAVFGRKYRFHSPQRVCREIKHLMKNYGIKEFHFKDSEFTLLVDRTENICDLIIKERLKIKWLCNGRVNHVNLPLLKKMKMSGCKSITYGVESGDENILKTLKKAYTLEDVRRAFKSTKIAKIESTANIIIGNPGDTKETIEKTIEFAKEIDADYANFNFLIPFPGTELYYMAKKNGWLLDNYRLDRIKYDICVMNATNLPTEELNKYVKKAFRNFYFRPGYILKRLGKMRWHEIKINLKGGLTLLKNSFIDS